MIKLAVASLDHVGAPATYELSPAESHYAVVVRRARVGDTVTVYDAAGRTAGATITAIGSGGSSSGTTSVSDPAATVVQVQVGPVQQPATSGPHITAAIPLIKGDRFDFCLEKLGEAGVDRVLLWAADHAVVQLDHERAAKRVAKAQAQLAAAVRQSGPRPAPVVQGVLPLADVLLQASQAEVAVVLTPGAPARLPEFSNATSLLMISGPEGGLSEAETAACTQAGVIAVGLGPRVLRAETAPFAAVFAFRLASSS